MFRPSFWQALVRNTQYAASACSFSKTASAQPITLVTLGTVYVTDNLIDSSDGEVPKQTLRLIYGQITESAGSVVKSWDLVTSKPLGPAPLPGPDLANLPVPTHGSIWFWAAMPLRRQMSICWLMPLISVLRSQPMACNLNRQRLVRHWRPCLLSCWPR